MTFDESLDRLRERHEALTQTVELMVHQQREWQEKNQILRADMLESIHSLAQIAQSHERRLGDWERPRG